LMAKNQFAECRAIVGNDGARDQFGIRWAHACGARSSGFLR
jgi:hypothetical protein